MSSQSSTFHVKKKESAPGCSLLPYVAMVCLLVIILIYRIDGLNKKDITTTQKVLFSWQDHLAMSQIKHSRTN